MAGILAMSNIHLKRVIMEWLRSPVDTSIQIEIAGWADDFEQNVFPEKRTQLPQM